MIESLLLLSLAGGAVAMLITTWSAGTFGSFIPPTNIPIALDVHADRTVLLVTLVGFDVDGPDLRHIARAARFRFWRPRRC